jgi:prephenate dehydratase
MDDKKLKKAIEKVREHCLYLKILGSYPSGETNG